MKSIPFVKPRFSTQQEIALASIKDVAAKAGVSTTTVSRVLSHPTAVSTVLREQVEQAIAELGYRPNLAARRLRQQRASLVGLIVSDIRSPFFTDVGRAVEDMAYRHGLRLILCNTDEDPEKERSYLQLMADEQASGVILSPTLEGLKRFDPSQWSFPVVMVDRAMPETPVDRVLLDNRAAARRATEHLVAAGYRRLALMVGTHSTTGLERQKGFEEAMDAAGLAPAQIMRVSPTRQAGAQATTAMLESADKSAHPDAILATNGLLLMGAVHGIQSAGLRMPQDIGLAGFDNNDWTALPSVDVTVIAQPTYEIGRNAAELLMQRLDEPERPVRRVLLEGELVARGSSRGPTRRA